MTQHALLFSWWEAVKHSCSAPVLPAVLCLSISCASIVFVSVLLRLLQPWVAWVSIEKPPLSFSSFRSNVTSLVHFGVFSWDRETAYCSACEDLAFSLPLPGNPVSTVCSLWIVHWLHRAYFGFFSYFIGCFYPVSFCFAYNCFMILFWNNFLNSEIISLETCLQLCSV